MQRDRSLVEVLHSKLYKRSP